ncbi:ribosomal protein S17 [Candidatus Carsonella ruddii HT isolate Thao2000]|uniref:30S ribosomal protein S17 n=1 Tax=Candidatus Carsonella ruddii HT isolate Thao2000 TaxID=1202539 RepID=J3TWD8_CARRU|nr:30S ribosomal protein S17 [Candidatus Carsonella ruddii]AFP84195.1 ribosomal protein S17 [Candidatus Carsonella ruddii HT isolate Thao2000]
MNNLYGRVIKKNYKKIIVIIKKNFFLPIYKKKIFYYSKISVYDMYNESNLGDLILIKKTRPLSKTTFWILSKIIEKIRLI